MIGPLLSSEENAVMEALSELGTVDAWILGAGLAPLDANRQSQKLNEALSQDISQPQRGFRIPNQPGSKASLTPVNGSRHKGDFNPVRLRKYPASFPDPRDKH
ncbi:MAG: hypothetical protein ACNYPE_07335 [Candidatus Azotimanducaceae bacterium WSBS_2022_MAG_OTU7]